MSRSLATSEEEMDRKRIRLDDFQKNYSSSDEEAVSPMTKDEEMYLTVDDIRNRITMLEKRFDRLEERLQEALSGSEKDEDEEKEEVLMPLRPGHIYVVGGYRSHSLTSAQTSAVLKYSLETKEWKETQRLPEAIYDVRTAIIGGELYSVGGRTDAEHKSTCHKLGKDGWDSICELKQPRYGHALAQYNSELIAIGGCYCGTHLKSCETFNIETNEWSTFPELNVARNDASCVVIGDKLFVLGGFDTKQVVKDVDMFDFKVGKWEKVTQMKRAREGMSCVAIDGIIYAIGGVNDSEQPLACIDTYNPATNEWEYDFAAMPLLHSFGGCVVDDGHIFIAGGFSGEGMLDTLLKFDPKTKSFVFLPQMTTPVERFGIASC